MPPRNMDAYYLQGDFNRTRQRVEQIFKNRKVTVEGGGEGYWQRLNRITREVRSGQRTLDDVRQSVARLGRRQRAPFEPERPEDPAAPPSAKPPAAPKRDFFGEARALMPWLDQRLLREFAKAWEDTDNVELAWGRVQQGSTFRSIYGDIIRPDGSLRMSPAEYHAVVDGYRSRLAGYGLNPNLFQNRISDLVQGDVSVQEFEQRLQAGYEQISSRSEDVRRWYADNYGLSMSDEALFASFIDPDINAAVLERRLTSAQIGGAAARFNFQRSLSRVEELAGIGVTGEAADQFYGQAARDLGRLGATSRRFGRGDVTLRDLEEAGLEGDPLELERLSRAQADEMAAFSRQGVARADEEGRRTGLNAL